MCRCSTYSYSYISIYECVPSYPPTSSAVEEIKSSLYIFFSFRFRFPRFNFLSLPLPPSLPPSLLTLWLTAWVPSLFRWLASSLQRDFWEKKKKTQFCQNGREKEAKACELENLHMYQHSTKIRTYCHIFGRKYEEKQSISSSTEQ